MFDVTVLGQAPILIATCPMTRVEADKAIRKVTQCVQAEVTLPNGPKGNVLCIRNAQVRIHIVQVPRKGFALKSVPKAKAFSDAAK